MEESSFVDGCDTELCLSPCSGRPSRRPSSNSGSRGGGEKEVGRNIRAREEKQQQQQQQQGQQITIFYNGRICICDVTEIQARAIISMAANQLKAAACNSRNNIRPPSAEPEAAAAASPPAVAGAAAPQLLDRSQSMKRSLQRFLQKRRTRSLETSPYDLNINSNDSNNDLASP